MFESCLDQELNTNTYLSATYYKHKTLSNGERPFNTLYYERQKDKISEFRNKSDFVVFSPNSKKHHFDRVVLDNIPLIVQRPNGERVVVISLEDYNSIIETEYLLLSKNPQQQSGVGNRKNLQYHHLPSSFLPCFCAKRRNQSTHSSESGFIACGLR